jgi:hypothetical protein
MAGNIHIHPAPGLGDLMPGWFAVPQDPITAAREGVTYTPGIGDILPGAFVVPQNPIKDFVSGQVKMIGQGQGKGYGNVQPQNAHPHSNGGCGCGGSCGGCSGSSQPSGGMGQISTDLANMGTDLSTGNFTQFFTDTGTLLQEPTVLGIPLWFAGIMTYFLVTAIAGHQVTVKHR